MALVQNLSVVRHGRRSGTPRSRSPQEDFLVLQGAELNRITRSLNKQERVEQDRINRANSIREAHEKSKKTVSTWTNTIDGQRKGKLVAKAKRDEQDEAARVALDLEEELFKSNERKKVIDRAKKLQFEHTDRTKEFHAALGFVEVLKERELQLAARKERAGLVRAAEVDYHLKSKAENEAAKEMEEQRKMRHRENEKQNQLCVNLQIEMKQDEAGEELEKWIEEGELLARHAIDEKNEKTKKAEIEKAKKIEMKKHLEIQFQLNKELDEELVKEDAKEDRKRKIYTHSKQKMMQMRQNKINELFQTQQEARGRMADHLTAEYKLAEDNLDQRMEAARLEKEAAEDKRLSDKTAKKAKAIDQISKHLQIQLQVKGIATQKRKEAARAELAEKKKADQLFKDKMKVKAEKKRAANEDHAQHYIKTVNEIATEERRQKEIEIEFEKRQTDHLLLEEDEFQQYAKEIIDQAAKADRNVFPLKAVAAKGAGGGHGPMNSKTGIRPSFLAADIHGAQMPTFKNELTAEVRRNLEPGSARTAKKRLGFNW